MHAIEFSDITLRSFAQGDTLGFKQKVEVVKLMDKLSYACIELPALKEAAADAILVRSLAQTVRQSALGLEAALSMEGIEAAWDAVQGAARPRIILPVPVSSVQMEYICHKKPAQMLEAVPQLVQKAVSLCADVEVRLDDASRAESAFLMQVMDAAVAAGATVITLCDSAGVKLPGEMKAWTQDIREKLPANVTLCVACGDALHMGIACAFAAIEGGAQQIKTAMGDGAQVGPSALSAVLEARGGAYACNINRTQLRRATQQVQDIVGTRRSATTPFDGALTGDAAPEAIDASLDKDALYKVVQGMGYELSEEDIANVHEAFLRVAVKKEVNRAELEAIIASSALQVPPTYKLTSYLINSGNTIVPSAHITLTKGGETRQGLCAGDGPIDAAFLAIEQIIGQHYELDDFQISAVTEGRGAMGDALVKLRSGGKLYSGKGISTDVIGASIRAYINALNKIVYEEKMV